ncbi:Hypothetical predicted protein [Paramuricea clavata]|uniref:P2X purinoreceptor 7 intracellular domain-containing protein n=1 Tax=Paramuricea clavata TaxID=317549 RepID=A0A7D9ICU0_PARCT|nr:Hypothetical predicted protein [Paramuricea clavata]
MNNKRAQESDSENTDSDFSIQDEDTESKDDESEEYDSEQSEESKGVQTRGRARGRGRGTKTTRKEGKGSGARGRGTRGGHGRGGRGQGAKRGGQSTRGKGGQSTRGRGGQSTRGRGGRRQLEEEPSAAENQHNHEQQLVNLVEGMEIDVLRRLALELLRRQPATFADIVSGELPGGNGAPDPDPDNTPEWCNCGHCMAMPTQEENKCCAQTRRPCVSRQALFNQIVLDANILDIAMRHFLLHLYVCNQACPGVQE